MITPSFEAFKISTLINELRIYVFVDAGHTKYMPAVIDIEEYVSIKIFIIFSLAISTYNYFCWVGSKISFWFFHDGWISILFCIKFIQNRCKWGLLFYRRRGRFIKLIKFLESQLHFVFEKLHKQITTLTTFTGVFLSNLSTSLMIVWGYFWQVSICLRILSSLTFCPHPGQSFLSSYLLSIAILRYYTID